MGCRPQLSHTPGRAANTPWSSQRATSCTSGTTQASSRSLRISSVGAYPPVSEGIYPQGGHLLVHRAVLGRHPRPSTP
eukprot:1992358-Alexandrium_andersonii.AAC.1